MLTLAIDGAEELALPKSVVRHPLRDYVEHVDLILIRRGERVTVDIQVDRRRRRRPRHAGRGRPDHAVHRGRGAAHPRVASRSPSRAPRPAPRSWPADVTLPEGATLAADPESLVVGVSLAPTTEDLEADGSGTEPPPAPTTAPTEGETADGARADTPVDPPHHRTTPKDGRAAMIAPCLNRR